MKDTKYWNSIAEKITSNDSSLKEKLADFVSTYGIVNGLRADVMERRSVYDTISVFGSEVKQNFDTQVLVSDRYIQLTIYITIKNVVPYYSDTRITDYFYTLSDKLEHLITMVKDIVSQYIRDNYGLCIYSSFDGIKGNYLAFSSMTILPDDIHDICININIKSDDD